MVPKITCMICIAVLCGTAAAADNYISFDVPGATSTGAQGINADGAVVGFYVDSGSKQHGFLLSGGNFTTLDYPGALSTGARGINAQGDIVGVHVDMAGLPGGGNRGWLLHQGTFQDVNYPGHMNTIPVKITDQGVMVGCYHDTDTMGTMHGWMLSNGNFSDLSTPASMNNGVLPDGSMTAGLYTDMMTNMGHAYLASGDNFAPFDFPFAIGTAAWDMNPSGEVVGTYTDTAKKTHGFLMIPGAFDPTFGIGSVAGVTTTYSFVSVDYPGATSTSAVGINFLGHIVGSYVDSSGKTHAFLLMRSRHGR
jgi:probable HAF family extracellular repeat protein